MDIPIHHVGTAIEKITDVLQEVADWVCLAGWLNINHHTIMTNCMVSGSNYASCNRRMLVEQYCDMQAAEGVNMTGVAHYIAQVLHTKMNLRRQSEILKKLSFTGKFNKCVFNQC